MWLENLITRVFQEPSALEFIFEILSIESPNEYKKETWQMDVDEKLGNIPKLKEEGNAMYRAGMSKDAADKYGEALTLLEQLMLR